MQQENTKLSNILKNNENNDLYKTLFEKEKTIKELKNKLSRYPIELNEGEKLLFYFICIIGLIEYIN